MTQTLGDSVPVSQAEKRVEDWKSRLIDLSRKNNLLYFRKTRRGNHSITQPEAQKIFDTLVVKNGRLEFYMPAVPKTDKTEQVEEKPKTKGRAKKTDNKTKGDLSAVDSEMDVKAVKSSNRAAVIAGEEAVVVSKRPGVNQLVLGDKLGAGEVDRALKALERRSLLDYRERGVRILYAAFGVLNWVDLETQENVVSPLVLVPLEIGKETRRAPYSIAVPPVEDEAVLNPALAAKLYNDYRIELPPLPEDWEGQTLAEYYRQIETAVAKFGWKTESSIDLGLFSFQKLVIYKDLDTNMPTVTQHSLVRAIAGFKEEGLIQTGLPEEKDVDIVEVPAKTYQVLDADSSQRLSIQYALHGQSFVMKGPPGTGKSQTIANIIAECIANGKSVLFVSDKMAALEVVYKRLSEVGLAHFCLEMHSSKANKQQVVAELKRSLDENLVPRKLPSSHDFDRLSAYRTALNGYVLAIHQKRQYLQRSAYEVLSIICSLERVPFIPVGLSGLSTLTPQKMRELEELVSHLSKVWAVVEEEDFPWVGYRADKYNLEIRSEVLTALENINQTLRELELETEDFSAKIGIFPPENFARIQWLLDVGNILYESPKPEQRWLLNPLNKLLAEAKSYLEITTWIKTTRTNLMERYTPALFELVLTRSQELQQAVANVGKASGTADLAQSELLAKREKFLAYLKSMMITVRKCKETAHSLAPMLGLDGTELTIGQLKQLSRMAYLCFADDKPEPQWFNKEYLQEVTQTVDKTKQLYDEHSQLKSR